MSKNLDLLLVDYFKAMKEIGKTKEEVINDLTKVITNSGFTGNVGELIDYCFEVASMPTGVNGSISDS